MEYFYSILKQMDEQLAALIKEGKLNYSDKLAILGLDEHSFAIRTLLENRGYRVECYISEKEERRERVRRSVKHALSHYFNKTDSYIRIFSVDEWIRGIDENWIILYASEDCADEIKKIVNTTDIPRDKIYCLYDWGNTGCRKKTEKFFMMNFRFKNF